MLLTSTDCFQNKTIKEYLRFVSGEAIIAEDFSKEIRNRSSNIMSTKAPNYDGMFQKARSLAINEMIHEAKEYDANAIVGVTLDYETVDNMIMVSVSGTAVEVEDL